MKQMKFKLKPFKHPKSAMDSLIKNVLSKNPTKNSNYTNFGGNFGKQLNNFSLKTFGGKKDLDFDGILNKKDCNPLSTMHQDFSPFRRQEKADQMTAARRFGGQKNIDRLQKIGSGRDRVVYALDKDKVLKVAKNPGGLTQNTSESDVEFLDMGKQYEMGLDYTVMRRNQKLSQKNKRHLLSIRKEVSLVPNGYREHPSVYKSNIRSHLSREGGALEKSGIGNNILDYEFEPQELFASRQWGQDSKGDLALNDGGALQGDDSLKRYRVKDFKHDDWQQKDWYEVQKQRHQYKHQGSDRVKYFKSPTGDQYGVVSDFFNADDQLQHKFGKSGASLQKQEAWNNMSGPQRDIERQNKYDTDGDRIPDEYDCEPNNIMAQHTDLRFGKGINESMMFVRPASEPNTIYLNPSKIPHNPTDENIQMLSNNLTHESMHHTLYEMDGLDTSARLDSITPVIVADNNNGVINKSTVGLPLGYKSSRKDVYSALTSKIDKDSPISIQYMKNARNINTVVDVYDRFNKRVVE